MKSLSDFSFSFCSFVEFLKQIKRIHVFFDYLFIVFFWSIFLFNQIINDSFADFFLQDFLHFIDFVVIKKFRKKNTLIWCCRLFVFCTISSKRREIHRECDKMKKELNDTFVYSSFRRCELILWIYMKVFDLNFII
jgi:hypothetical protein